MLVHITSFCQCNFLWYLRHFPVFYLGIPVSAITSPCQYNILWYLPPTPFSVSFLGIPVSILPHIFLVRIFTTFLQKTLLFHISQMLILFSSCSCYARNQHPLYIFIWNFFPFTVKQMSFQILAPFQHYFWIYIIFGSTLNEILFSFFNNNFNLTHLLIQTIGRSSSFLCSL